MAEHVRFLHIPFDPHRSRQCTSIGALAEILCTLTVVEPTDYPIRGLHCSANGAGQGSLCRTGAAPERIQVFGSVKFDLELPPSLYEQAEALRRQLGVNRPILIAGSTRDGEERIIVEAFNMISKRLKGLLLVLAPRHPERFDEVAEMCRSRGLAVVRCSTRAYCSDETDVYLVDAMGELPRFYAASDVAFVGGSLLPYGGHNVLEPASLGIPVLVGPHTYNFSEICRILEIGGALQVVSDEDELARAALDWLVDSNERDRIGNTGAEIVRQHRGATKRTVQLIRGILNRG